MYFKLLSIGFLSLCVLLGCSSEQDSPITSEAEIPEEALPDFSSIKTDNVFVYDCADTLQFTAYVTEDSTWLFLSDTTLKVLPVSSGSGARYEGNAYLFWSKDEEAILQKPQGSFMICQTLPQEKSWKAAKLRGVDFRALGQEPGWHLEIKNGEQIRYIGNYGQDTVTTAFPDPQKEEQEMVYRAETENYELEVEISDELCTDSMSGFEFPFTVSVTLDGKSLKGCGRDLR